MHTNKARFAQTGKAPNTQRSAKETTYAHATMIPDVLAESPTQLKPTHMLARPLPTVTKDAPRTAKAAKRVTEPTAQKAEPTTMARQTPHTNSRPLKGCGRQKAAKATAARKAPPTQALSSRVQMNTASKSGNAL